MVSYFKTQWFRIFAGILCFVVACTYVFSPAQDASTIEGLSEVVSIGYTSSIWFAASLLWFVISFVSYNTECIEKLNERIEALEREKKND